MGGILQPPVCDSIWLKAAITTDAPHFAARLNRLIVHIPGDPEFAHIDRGRIAQGHGRHGVGGYIAGRLRKRVDDASEHEIDVRDGAHGLILWGVGIILASILFVVGVSGVVGGAAEVATMAAEARKKLTPLAKRASLSDS